MKVYSILLISVTLFNFVQYIVATTSKPLDKIINACQNGKALCGDQKTCCASKFGGHQCCQYSNAVCCGDQLHCCPEGTICDLTNKRCIHHSNEPIEWPVVETMDPAKIEIPKYTVERNPLSEFIMKVGGKNVCPDGGQCPGLDTCCLMLNGQYGCCPYPLGVCCPDKQTCCPQGTHCVSGGCA